MAQQTYAALLAGNDPFALGYQAASAANDTDLIAAAANAFAGAWPGVALPPIIASSPPGALGAAPGLGAARIVGTTTTGSPPTSGKFSVGDVVIDLTYGCQYACTVAGSPGQWATQNSGRASTYVESLSVSGSITSSAFLPGTTPITYTAGPAPLTVEFFSNQVVPSAGGVTSRLWVYDEGFAVVAFDAYVSASAADVRSMKGRATKTYPVGTVKTFTLTASTSGGSAVYGSGAAGSLGPCYWMRVGQGA